MPSIEGFPSPKGSFCLVYWAVNLLEKVGLQLIQMQANNEQDLHLSRVCSGVVIVAFGKGADEFVCSGAS